MCSQYSIEYKGKTIGALNFFDEKLYYRYEGRLVLNETGIFRVFAIMPTARINLGVCFPQDGHWYVRGIIAKKVLNLNKAQFYVHGDNDSVELVVINENDPFYHLELLGLCRFRLNIDRPELIILEND